MRAEAALGEPARALATYERFRRLLADEFGVDPAPKPARFTSRSCRTTARHDGTPAERRHRSARPRHARRTRRRDSERCERPGARPTQAARLHPAHRRGRHRQDPARRRARRRGRSAAAASCCRHAATRPSGRCSCSRSSRRSARTSVRASAGPLPVGDGRGPRRWSSLVPEIGSRSGEPPRDRRPR